MQVADSELFFPRAPGGRGLLEYARDSVERQLPAGELPVRFVVAETTDLGYRCEVATLAATSTSSVRRPASIFELRRRTHENAERFNVVLLVPTGVGCAIGGEAGDATPVARLLASVCDRLIVHPNIVNASDINEAPDNCLYVEGSVICRLLMGTVGLQPVRSNRILLVVDEHESGLIVDSAINAASAARATLGCDISGVVRLRHRFVMRTSFTGSGRASGVVAELEHLWSVLEQRRDQYDAVALTSVIQTPEPPEQFVQSYYHSDGVNPWGGVEAMLTHAVSTAFDVPSAHSPMMESLDVLTLDVGLIDPRKAAEAVSRTFLHCLFKGLHRSPRIVADSAGLSAKGVLTAEDVSCLVIPEGCLGLPTLAALEQGITVIAVRENTNVMRNRVEELPFRSDRYFAVDNYLEAAGLLAALKAGVSPGAVRRPLAPTEVRVYEAAPLVSALSSATNGPNPSASHR